MRMIKRRQNCQFLENSFNPFFNSHYATSFFHSQSPPRPLSLVNNFQMRWHRMVLVVRVYWSLCLFASIVLRRGESFSTDYASPTEPNTQAQALADKHESHTPNAHMRNTHLNTPTLPYRKQVLYLNHYPGPLQWWLHFCEKVKVPRIGFNSSLAERLWGKVTLVANAEGANGINDVECKGNIT